MSTLSLSSSELLPSVHNTTLETWTPFYAKRNDIYIDIDTKLAYPPAVPDTLQGENPRIIINPNLCMEQFNFTPSEFLVVLFHEIEHLFEHAQLRASPEGEEGENVKIYTFSWLYIWNEYNRKNKFTRCGVLAS